MPSQKQLEANRTNARKSTGPRTAAGQAAVRFNALQSGIDAYSEVIPGEDQAKLQALVNQYQLRWNPQTPETQALVDICVHSDWLLRRMRHVEAGFWKTRLGHARMLVNCTELEAHVFEYGGHIFERIQRRVNALQRNLQNALKDLARLQAAERAEEAAQSAAETAGLPEPAPESAPPPRVQPQSAQSPEEQIGFVPALAENAPSAIPPQPETAAPNGAGDARIA